MKLRSGMQVRATPVVQNTKSRYPEVIGPLVLSEGSLGDTHWPVYAVGVVDDEGYEATVVVDPETIEETDEETTVVEFNV